MVYPASTLPTPCDHHHAASPLPPLQPALLTGVVPTTNPTSTAIFKALLALKTRNALVLSPHPRAAKCTIAAAKIILDAAVAAGAPADIIGWIEKPTLAVSQALMTAPEVSLILATGGCKGKEGVRGLRCREVRNLKRRCSNVCIGMGAPVSLTMVVKSNMALEVALSPHHPLRAVGAAHTPAAAHFCFLCPLPSLSLKVVLPW